MLFFNISKRNKNIESVLINTRMASTALLSIRLAVDLSEDSFEQRMWLKILKSGVTDKPVALGKHRKHLSVWSEYIKTEGFDRKQTDWKYMSKIQKQDVLQENFDFYLSRNNMPILRRNIEFTEELSDKSRVSIFEDDAVKIANSNLDFGYLDNLSPIAQELVHADDAFNMTRHLYDYDVLTICNRNNYVSNSKHIANIDDNERLEISKNQHLEILSISIGFCIKNLDFRLLRFENENKLKDNQWFKLENVTEEEKNFLSNLDGSDEQWLFNPEDCHPKTGVPIKKPSEVARVKSTPKVKFVQECVCS